MGGGAAAESVEVGRELGADLTGHRSRPLSAELVAQADFLIGMTHGHLLALAGLHRAQGPQVRLLGDGNEEIADPIGCEQEVYRQCARQIDRRLQKLVAELHP